MTKNNFSRFSFLLVLGVASQTFSHSASLQLGADYLLRGVSITERDSNFKGKDYYDQRLQAYLTTSLSKEVEATVRVQSITPWGMEGSTNPLVTRYPSANGNLWVQNAFVRLPNIWDKKVIVTVGRQPIIWGSGEILSDDDLGFNAIRAQIKSPVRWLNFDLDGFTAKIQETMADQKDTDLNGVLLGFDHDYVRWEFMGLFENNKASQNYEMGAGTAPFSITKSNRTIYGVRAMANLKDAYLFGSYYMQGGKMKRPNQLQDIKLSGSAYSVGLGGRQENKYVGRVGAFLEYSEGSGDNPGSTTEDESFRPTFASRWSGLERSGKGRYFAATFSDAYSPSDPFGPVSSINDGLPAGTSGIQTAHFGLEFNPWAPWLFNFDYFQYKAVKNLSGPKELGTEFDYSIAYQYSGLVAIRVTTNDFKPGKAFEQVDANGQITKKKAKFSSVELEVKF